MPEPVNSVVVGDPAIFQVEHSDKEPQLVFIKALTTAPAETNLLISTTHGHEASPLVISRGDSQARIHVDFVLKYKTAGGFLIGPSGYPSALIGETLAAGQAAPASVGESLPSAATSSVNLVSLSTVDPVRSNGPRRLDVTKISRYLLHWERKFLSVLSPTDGSV